jgi:endonuclease YncB( thermonuclease family)
VKRLGAKLLALLTTIMLGIILFNTQAIASPAFQTDLSGTVSYVHDGDTFDINNGKTAIRLADINAPEIGETGYSEAKWFLYNIVYGKTVYLDQSTLNGQSYDRLVCLVYIDYDSQYYLNVNEKMIESGYAKSVDYTNDFNPNSWTLLVSKNTQHLPSTQSGARTADDPIIAVFIIVVVVVIFILLFVFRERLKKNKYDPNKIVGNVWTRWGPWG